MNSIYKKLENSYNSPLATVGLPQSHGDLIQRLLSAFCGKRKKAHIQEGLISDTSNHTEDKYDNSFYKT